MRTLRICSAAPLVALIFTGLSSLPASAQSLPEEECASLADPEAEITCLRAVLAATRQAQQGTPETNNADTVRNVPAPSTARPAPASPAAPTPAPRAVQAATPDLGIEQVARAPGEPRNSPDRDAVVTAITDFRTDRYGALIMQLENGQIWRQVENLGRPLFLDEGERVGVEITRSGFGGYRMSFADKDRKIAVSRIR